MTDFDPFNLKPTQRQCPSCADGRLHPEPIGDSKVNLYCDTRSYFHLYEREREATPVLSPPPAIAPTKDTPMPRKPDPDMTTNQIARWRNAGKPDRAKFIAAGCPTPSKWAKLQGATPSAKTPPPKPAKQPKQKTAPVAAAAPKPATTATTATTCKLSIKAVAVSFEGEGADLNNIIGAIFDAIR